jgi:Mn2+/Fe2+ NRAMP family transporter
MGVIAGCLIVAMVYLFSVAGGGAIGSKNLLNAVVKFLGFYVPLLSLVATFFFKERQGDGDSATPAVTFYFAMFIVTIWVLTPILILLSGLYIEEVLDYIDRLIPLGESLALMALGYYFTKSSP